MTRISLKNADKTRSFGYLISALETLAPVEQTKALSLQYPRISA